MVSNVERNLTRNAEAQARGRRFNARDVRIAAAVFLVALGLRAAYVREIANLPDFDMPAVDAGYHDYWAWGLASGDWSAPPYCEDPDIQTTPYFRPPLCPYFLALVYSICGHSYVAVRIAQMLVGATGCVLAYMLALRMFGRPTAIITGFAMAAYWAFIYFDTELREVVLLVTLHVALVLLLITVRRRPTALRSIACGVVLGLAALGKPNVLLFAPIAAVWLYVVTRQAVPRRRSILAVAGLLVGTLLPVTPAIIRNAVVARDLVFISSNGGINLYIGNNPLATGHDVRLPPPIPEFATAFDYPKIVRHVETVEGRSLKHSEVSAHFTNRAIVHIKSNPWHTARLLLCKAILFWGGVEITSEKDLNAARGESRLLRYLPGNFSILFACSLVGVWFAARAPRECDDVYVAPARADVVLVLLFVGTYFLSFLPFFVTARYRVPIVPFMIVFAGYGAVRVAAALHARRLALASVSIAAFVALYAVNRIDYYGVSEDGFKAKYARAVAYGKKAQWDKAITTYRKALQIRPNAPKAHNNLGLALAETGQTDQAVHHYAQALQAKPDYAEAHNNLGVELLQANDLERAIIHLREAVRLSPQFVLARKNLALALALNGDNGAAIQQYGEALRIDPNDAGAHYNRGVLLDRQGRATEAIREYRLALDVNPAHAKAREALAAALTAQPRDTTDP